MAKPNRLESGDRVAYAAKFLRNTGQFTGGAPQRRGTFVSYDRVSPDFARVKWDDFEANAACYAELYGDDYVADARESGQMVHANNIAKIGSPRVALNDM